jgi:hypothetical protein
MIKKCNKCLCEKDISNFNKNKSNSDGFHGQCRVCDNLASRAYYAKNRELHKQNINRNRQKYRLQSRINLIEYLKNNPCVDCGETDPIVLQFDHVEIKSFNISEKIGVLSWDNLLTEIKKCEVRCANCHTRKTAKDYKWFKYFISQTS